MDGDVFAQPLYLSNFTINGASHDVLYVATSNNSVYAFDADSNTGANANPLWKVNLGTPCPPSGNIYSTTGIVGTPVISLTNNAIYVVAATLDASGNWVKSIHALDLTTGAELFGGPMVIQAVVNGKGDGNDGAGHVPFNPQIQNERSALLLGRMKYVSPNGKVTYRDTVYIAFASYGDQGPYHGWVIAYDALTLQQVAVWNSTPNAKTWPSGYPIAAGGIWMSGYGPASDGRFVYFMTGNGGFDPADQSYGDSIVQMETKNGLAVGNYFTPSDEHSLDDADEDLGSGGLMLLPDSVGSVKHPDLLVGAGKDGRIFLVDRYDMGKFVANANHVVQEVDGQIGGMWSGPAYFNNKIYFGGQYDSIKAFSISNATISTSPTAATTTQFTYPGPTPSISSDGTTNGIVWALDTQGYNNGGEAVLHAYNAANLKELYNNTMITFRDSIGNAVEFVPPTIANGKVYVGVQGEVAVFGELSHGPPPLP